MKEVMKKQQRGNMSKKKYLSTISAMRLIAKNNGVKVPKGLSCLKIDFQTFEVWSSELCKAVWVCSAANATEAKESYIDDLLKKNDITYDIVGDQEKYGYCWTL